MTSSDTSLTPPSVFPQPNRTQALLATAVITIGAMGWAMFIRSSSIGEPFTFANWTDFSLFTPYILGFALQETLIPLALLYALSRTSLFRRVVTHTQAATDEWQLAGTLLGMQFIVFLLRLGLVRTTDDQATIDLLIALVAGLLGGWWSGLGVGLFATFLIGLGTYISWGEPSFSLATYFEYAVLKNMEAIVAVWAGSVMGFVLPVLRERRFQPLITAVLSMGLIIFAFWLMLYATTYPAFYLDRLLPNAVIFALAQATVALMVRNVQDEESRRRAESARLELAQANLNLAQTRLALTQAELRALHAQINPHFFFNTLNTIRYFVRTNPDKARDLLIKLSEIFQRALSAGEFVPLRDEISYVEAYLALEKARLDERLKIVWTNLAKSLLETPVPTLVLQPLVENAVIHGVSQQPDGGTIHIILNRLGDDLLVQVDDDGLGFDVSQVLNGRSPTPDSPEPARPSIGLRNVDERLRMLYGEPYRLHIESQPGQGTTVVFKIPLSQELTQSTQ